MCRRNVGVSHFSLTIAYRFALPAMQSTPESTHRSYRVSARESPSSTIVLLMLTRSFRRVPLHRVMLQAKIEFSYYNGIEQ